MADPIDRRTILTAAAVCAAGLAAPLAARNAATRTNAMANTRIDIHQHFLPAFYRQALADAGISPPDGMAATPEWSEAEVLAMLDKFGIGTAILSISSPGVHLGDDAQARDLARRTNEEAARVVRNNPGRFGFFAATPLPDVDGAVAEIAYAFDRLKADGVVFETNFRGTYLGDDRLAPVYAELNRRRAVVFVHPTQPECQCSAVIGCNREPRDLAFGWPYPMIEFMFETTRTVTQMLLSGTLARYPDIRVVVPHAGAALPALAGRIEAQKNIGSKKTPDAPDDIRAALRRLHYDMAGAPVPETLAALLHFADRDQLHYGSDWPFTTVEGGLKLLAKLEETPLFDDRTRAAMFGGNARRLFPRLA